MQGTPAHLLPEIPVSDLRLFTPKDQPVNQVDVVKFNPRDEPSDCFR